MHRDDRSMPAVETGSDTHERLSGTDVQSHSAPVVSATRSVRAPPGPPGATELAHALAGVSLDAPPTAAVRAVVDALAYLLPALAAGACHAEEPDAPPAVVRARCNGAPPSDPPSLELNAARLFPASRHERVVHVECAPAILTLHLAGDDPTLDDDGPHLALARHAALLLRAPLAAARARAEVRALREQLVQLDKLATFGQVAAGIVHELNNPLTAIVATADVLLRKAPQGEDGERVRRISEAANRLLRFARELVTYVRLPGAARTAVDLHAAIDQAMRFCEHELERAGAVVERRYGPPASVLGLPQDLVQVFVNLFTNSCHAMPAGGGTMVIRTETDGQRVRVVLDDTGHGIAPEALPHVFRAFYTTKAAGRGTGLGLSIVKSIVEAHEGDVRVESTPRTADGAEGTRFIVTLPLRP